MCPYSSRSPVSTATTAVASAADSSRTSADRNATRSVAMAADRYSFVIQQSALRTDVLAPAMASSNAVTLFASVVFGPTVFGETLSDGHGRLAPAVIGPILALAGIVLLAGAKPPLAEQAHSAIGHAPASSSPPGA